MLDTALSKIAVLVLIALSAVDVNYQSMRFQGIDMQSAEYFTPFSLFLSIITLILVMILMLRGGITTSRVLFIFWFLMSTNTGINYYIALEKTLKQAFSYVAELCGYHYAVAILYFGLTCVVLFVNCFSDQRIYPESISVKESPEERASVLSKLTFWWFNSMIYIGYKKPLTSSKMYKLKESHQTKALEKRFNKYWLPELQFVKRTSTKASSIPAPSPSDFEKDSLKLSILKPFMKMFAWELLVVALLRLGSSVIPFVNPVLLNFLIIFVNSNQPIWIGLSYAVGMFLVAMLESFLNGHYEHKIQTIAMNFRSCTISIIYKKALTMSFAARNNFTVGELVNLMSIDMQKMMDYIQMVNLLWSTPLQIAIAVYLLWQQLGAACLSGVAVMVLIIPLNGVFGTYSRDFYVQLMKDKDHRIKLMNEILNGIKVLKLYVWENLFIEKVVNIRKKEIRDLRAQAYIGGGITFVYYSAPFLVSLASFATYVLMDSNNVLDANRAFVSISLFSILRSPTAWLPIIMSDTVLFVVSLKRINKYLQSEDIDPDVIQHDQSERDPVLVKNGTFLWSKKDDSTLQDLNFCIKEGSLVAVVGLVGAGKSSLLSALLGEMEKSSGRVNVRGSVSYVPQQPFIQNKTLRQNILFTKPYDSEAYREVIDACALLPDLEILPDGHMTEIGEKVIGFLNLA